MELLERYLLQVERYLPLKEKIDTIEELRSLLLEEVDSRMAEGETLNDALYIVIKGFGDPKDIALKYRNDAAIISREMEPFLYLVLKIVICAVPLAILLATSISFLSRDLPFNFSDFLLNILYTLPEMFSGALSAVGTVFIVFVLIEKYLKPQFLKELEAQGLLEFDPKNLPKVPNSVFKVSIAESVFAITASLVFLYILNYQQGIIAIYFEGTSIPFLNDNFSRILPVMNVSITFGIFIEAVHLIRQTKSMVTTTFEYMNKLLATVIFILLASSSIINTEVIEAYHLEVVVIMFIIGMSIGALANAIGGSITYGKVLLSRSGKEEILRKFDGSHKEK